MKCSCVKDTIVEYDKCKEIDKLNIDEAYKRVSADLFMCLMQESYVREMLLPSNDFANKISAKDHAYAYLKFRNIIDLSHEKMSILIFDLDTFSTIFGYNYYDEYIFNFIKKLINDPLVYNKQQREDFFLILMIAFFYSLKQPQIPKEYSLELKRKLNDNLIYFNKNKNIKFNFYILKEKIDEKNKSTFKVKINNKTILTSTASNFIINNAVINLYNFVDFYDEGIFLNYFYKNLCKRKNNELLLDFKKRLRDNIRRIDKKYFVFFIKLVFLNESVVFDKISDDQLIRIVLSFLTKEKDSLDILEYFMSYFIFKEEYNFILNRIIEIKKEKSGFLVLRKEITFDKLKEAFINNKESFIFIKGLFDELTGIIKFTNDFVILEGVFNYLELVCFIYTELKTEFVIQMDKKFIKLITDAFTIIYQTIKKPFIFEECIKKSGEYIWPILSKILLAANKPTTEIKKSKKGSIERTNNTIIDLIELIRKCENIFVNEGVDWQIKKWGFQLVEKQNK